MGETVFIVRVKGGCVPSDNDGFEDSSPSKMQARVPYGCQVAQFVGEAVFTVRVKGG